MAEREARVVVKAVDQLTEPVRRINRSVETMVAPIRRVATELRSLRDAVNANAIVRGLDQVGASARRVGRQMTTYVTAPILGAGALVLRTAVDFEQGMNNIAAVSQAPADQIELLRDMAKDLGATTQFSASQAAAGMEFLARAGLQTNEILASTPGLLNLAAATGSDLGFTADVASNIMGALDLGPEDMMRIADVLAATTSSANVDLRMLAEGFAKAGRVGADFGMSLEETAAALGLLGNIGIQGGDGGTALRNSMLRLAAPSSEASKMMAEMGVETMDAQGNMREYADILTDFGVRLESLGSGVQLEALNTLFGLRTITGASELIKQANSGALQEYAAQLNDVDGRAQSMADTINEGLPGALRSMKSAFEGLMIAVGESGLVEAVTELTTRLTEFLREVTKTNPETIRFYLTLLAVAAAIGPLLVWFGLMASGMAGVAKAVLFAYGALKLLSAFMLANPLFAAIAAIGFAVYAIYDNWDNIVAYFTEKIDLVVAAFDEGFLEGLKSILREFDPITLLSDAFYGLIDWIFGIDSRAAVEGFISGIIENLTAAWEDVKAWFWETFDALMAWIGSFETVQAGLEFIGGLWDGFEAGWNGLVRWFHEAMQGIWDWLMSFSLFEAGIGIVQSIWDGLKAKWNELVAWLEEKINALVEWMPDWVKDQLGISTVDVDVALRVLNPDEIEQQALEAGNMAAFALGRRSSSADRQTTREAAAAAERERLLAQNARLEQENNTPAAIVRDIQPALVTVPGRTVPDMPVAPLPSPLGHIPVPASRSGREPPTAAERAVEREAMQPRETRVDAPVSVTLTFNGISDVEVVRREAEAAVRRALEDWERRQRSASAAALYD